MRCKNAFLPAQIVTGQEAVVEVKTAPMSVKRKLATPDYAGLYLDLPTSYDSDVEYGQEVDKGHDTRNVSDQLMSYWLSVQASPFIVVMIILCFFMAGFMATHTNQMSHDFHIISDSFHDSHRPITPIAPVLVQTPPIPQMQPALDLGAGWEGCLTEIPPDPSRRHIVPPPTGDVTLVCCNTTKGMLSIEVHPTWAPHGAARFLLMVRDGFFSSGGGVPLFRAMKGFLVQFGLSGDPAMQSRYHEMGNLPDDPSWLPLGPPGRQINGIKRYQAGYLGYAGAGKDSRGTQLILAFEDNLMLGGGSPWEVPFGQLIGESSFATMRRFYTKYGEKPSQGKIMNRGMAYIREDFPLLDVISECRVVRENVTWAYAMP